MYDSSNGWGDFLSSGMHDTEAHVICVQLGYAGGTVSTRYSNGPYTGLHWCFNRACVGREHFLFECEQTNNCGDNGEDANVKCFLPQAKGVPCLIACRTFVSLGCSQHFREHLSLGAAMLCTTGIGSFFTLPSRLSLHSQHAVALRPFDCCRQGCAARKHH